MIDALLLFPVDVERMLAARVRSLRQDRGWSQEELATRAGLGVATVARMERSGRGQVASLLRIASALGRLRDFEAVLAPPEPRTLADVRARGARR
jgi:transcriptional regulator with XRE-family HTH domain